MDAQVKQIVAKAQQTPVLVACVDLLDKSGANDVPVSVLEKVADRVHQQQPATSFMLVAAGKRCCQLLAIRGDNQDRLSAAQWILSCSVHDAEFGSDEKAHGRFDCAEQDSPLKRKEVLIQAAFDYLRANDLMPDEESSEEILGLDLE